MHAVAHSAAEGYETSMAPATHKQAVFVSITSGDGVPSGCDNIVVIILSNGVYDQTGEMVTTASAAAIVGNEDTITE